MHAGTQAHAQTRARAHKHPHLPLQTPKPRVKILVKSGGSVIALSDMEETVGYADAGEWALLFLFFGAHDNRFLYRTSLLRREATRRNLPPCGYRYYYSTHGGPGRAMARPITSSARGEASSASKDRASSRTEKQDAMKDAMARCCATYATYLLPGTIRPNHQNEAQSRNQPQRHSEGDWSGHHHCAAAVTSQRFRLGGGHRSAASRWGRPGQRSALGGGGDCPSWSAKFRLA